MDRAEKAQTVDALKADFTANTLAVVAHYTGLTVAELTDLRQRMGKAEASFQVTKNRLARIAIKDTDFANLDDMFRGPTGVALSKDPVAAAKVATAFAKDNEKFVVLGGSPSHIVATQVRGGIPAVDRAALLVALGVVPAAASETRRSLEGTTF